MVDHKNKKILFYVHFNKYNKVEDYVIYQLQQMRFIFDKIILISNSSVTRNDKKKFIGLYDVFIQRGNKGFDFAAWRDGFNKFGWNKLDKYDELTIMNDTCFGPIHDFSVIYDNMRLKKIDFWGISNNIALVNVVKDSSGNFVYTPEHIQSYYITFNKKTFLSDIFRNFWDNVQEYSDVSDVVVQYETKLTNTLINDGFTYDTYYNIKEHWKKNTVTQKDLDISLKNNNMKKYSPGYTVMRPLWLLETVNNYPFIKTKAITMSSNQLNDIRQYISNNTKYPVRLMDSYIANRIDDIIKAKELQIKDIQSSRSYKIGRVVTYPWRIVKGWIR